MSDEQDKLKVSLEPPKLFGRKKKSGKGSEPEPTPERSNDPARPSEPEADAAEGAPAEEEPRPAEPEPEPEAAEPEPPEPEPTLIEPEPGPEGAVDEPDLLDADDDEPVIDEIEVEDDEDDLAPRPPAAADEAEHEQASVTDRIRNRLGMGTRAAAPAATESGPGPGGGDGAYTAPMLANYPAAALTGAIVGLGMVVLTWLSLRGCEAIRGTATCGGGPGFLLLVATFIVSVMLGSAILKSFEVPDPGSSSFLAVGVVAVVALLFLVDALDHWSMLVVIPVITVGGYLLSVYITKTFVEPDSS